MSHLGPSADLFETTTSAKCRWICLRGEHSLISMGDAQVIMTPHVLLYAYPPMPLLFKFLNKLKQEKLVIIHIAPSWPRQMWFLELVFMSLKTSFCLPLMPSLLTQESKSVTQSLSTSPQGVSLWHSSIEQICSTEIQMVLFSSRNPTTRKTYLQK